MDKNKNYLIEALVIFSNLAIPPNDKVDKGLGDLLGFEEYHQTKIVAELLIEKYEKYFNLIYKYVKKELNDKNLIKFNLLTKIKIEFLGHLVILLQKIVLVHLFYQMIVTEIKKQNIYLLLEVTAVILV